VYTKDDAKNAPEGVHRYVGTAVEVLSYRLGDNDLCILVNVNGICCYRCTLQGPFRPGLEPSSYPATNPMEDAFVVREIAKNYPL